MTSSPCLLLISFCLLATLGWPTLCVLLSDWHESIGDGQQNIAFAAPLRLQFSYEKPLLVGIIYYFFRPVIYLSVYFEIFFFWGGGGVRLEKQLIKFEWSYLQVVVYRKC